MTDWLLANQRVVITGIGAVTPCGLDMASTWDNVRNGRSGIRKITLFDTSDFKVKIAGEAHGYDPLNSMTRKEARRRDRFSQFAVTAAEEAVLQAGLTLEGEDRWDTGVYIGCGTGGVATYQSQQSIMDSKGPGHINPLLIPMLVPDSAAVQIGIRFGARGPTLGMSSACSTSIDSVGMALETIRRGDASVMIAGGSEAAISTLGIGGFDRLGALSRRNGDPAAASRPFARDRDGFVLSEGAVVLVLESLEHSLKRNVEPLAELRSYAATADARHLTAPDEEGKGAARCMVKAIAKAGLSVSDIGYVNAHATSTPVGDPIEVRALKRFLGSHLHHVSVSSTKSVTGHLLGGAGALATALMVQSLRDGFLPPTINLEDPGEDCRLNHVTGSGRDEDVTVGMVPCYGFGGHNSCLVVKKWSE